MEVWGADVWCIQKGGLLCRSMIFVTFDDYPMLFALSRQIKGKMGCLVCLDGTTWLYLDASKKIVYLRYRRFLKTTHKYHNKMYFRFYDNTLENEPLLRDIKTGNTCLKWWKAYMSSLERRIWMG
jgi:hypothetical protein